MEFINRLFGLDGKEEFIFYGASAGTVRINDDKAEEEYYDFLQSEPGTTIS